MSTEQRGKSSKTTPKPSSGMMGKNGRKFRQQSKISEALMHRHTFHHGPLMNTRKPHIPHG